MNYGEYADKALAKIRQYGASCELIHRTSVYDTETNEYTNEDTVCSGFCIMSVYDEAMSDTIRKGDVRLMCVFDDEPLENDIIRVKNDEYTVVSVNSLKPDCSTVIYYIVQGRKNG